MDSLFQLALSSQTICGGIQFLLFSISLGAVVGALQHHHANDILTFSCSPKPSEFIKQLCYDSYISTVSPLLIPRNVAAITYGVLCVCWICFMLYGAVTLRQIKREQAERNQRRRQWRKFLSVYIMHVCFRLVFLSIMIGLFCSYQTLHLPKMYECHSSQNYKTNTTSFLSNQTGTVIQCNDLHYKEKTNLNIAIIVIIASIVILSISEVFHFSLTREKLHKKLLGDVFDIASNVDIENTLASNGATESEKSSSAVFVYTKALKASSKNQTEFQSKLMASSTLSNRKTDEIFTSLLIKQSKKPREKEVSELLIDYGVDNRARVKACTCEEIFIRKTDGEENPKSVLVTGKAGIGKSLFCQKLIRDWADNQLFMPQENEPLPDFKFVYLLTFRQLGLLGNNLVTLKQILNLSSLLDDQSNIDNSLFEYIVHHPEEVLIIMDGYDEYSQQDDIANNSEEQYSNNAREEMPVASLCAKLIKGKILRDSVIMVTSRPDESDKMGGIQFDRYVEISGFSAEQVKEYIEKYFSENEAKKNIVLEHVMNNESLVSFAHIPVLCFLMCWYMEYTLALSKINEDLPVSATDLYSEVVNMFELKHHSNSEFKGKGIPEKPKDVHFVERTVDKLSEFAARLLLQRRPVFCSEDLEDKFNSDELENLKGSGLLHCGPPFMKSAFETTKHLCFIHFTIHEYLAARWFVMRREVPKQVVSGMVLQFMAGMLSKKRDEKLMEVLLDQIHSAKKQNSRLLTVKCLNEYQRKEFAKNFLKKHYYQNFGENNKMEFRHLTDVDCIAISFLLDTVSELKAEEEEEEEEEEEQQQQQQQHHHLQQQISPQHKRSQKYSAESLDISLSHLTMSGIKHICKSLDKEFCHVTKLNVIDCPLTYESIVCISGLVSNGTLTELGLPFDNITDAGVARLCKSSEHLNSKLAALNLTANQITDVGVASICEALKHPNCKVTTLDLSDNQITDTGLGSLCEALQHPFCKVSSLNLSNSEVTEAGIVTLCQAFKNPNCEILSLDLSGIQMTENAVACLCEAMEYPNCPITILILNSNQMHNSSVARIAEVLKHANCKVTALGLSQDMCDASVASLCTALKHPRCKVTTLGLSGTRMTDTGVDSLCDALRHINCKVTSLDLRMNFNVSEEGKTSLMNLVQHRPDFELLL